MSMSSFERILCWILISYCFAAAARATDGCLLSVHYEPEKQEVLRYFLKEMGLVEYVKFFSEDPSTFIPQREGNLCSIEFVEVFMCFDCFLVNSFISSTTVHWSPWKLKGYFVTIVGIMTGFEGITMVELRFYF